MEMLRNEKITVLRKRENPDSQSFICLQTEVCTGGLGDSGGKLIFVFRLGFTILLDDMYPESVGDTGSYE